MASDDTMTIQSSVQEEDSFDDSISVDDHTDTHQPQPHNLSRLSVCTSTAAGALDCKEEEEEENDDMGTYLSRLSIETFDGEVDADGEEEEFSDGKDQQISGLSSDSENELGSCYSLPATPPRRRGNNGGMSDHRIMGIKDYASDYGAEKAEGWKEKTSKNELRRRRRRRCRQSLRDKLWAFDRSNYWGNCDNRKKEEDHGVSGESDQSVGGGSSGIMVITRPKGGRRSLCMDLEEVKACRDLGFELEHERMFEMPSHLSLSNSTLDTSSGGNSPISSWRISSPGDDPREVKARLKVWAQAVALASASKCST